MNKTFVESVDDFVKASDWLTDADQIAVVSLYKMAAQLDEKISANMMSAFGLVLRNLQKQKPQALDVDELDKLLIRAD